MAAAFGGLAIGRRGAEMAIRIDNSTVSDRAWGDVDKAALARRLAEIAAAHEEAERKALEEQERYKELYEKERQAREAEATARREDTIRSRFLLAAQSRGVVDPDVAYIIAKTLPEFAGVALGDDGVVTGIDAVIESLIGSKPYLVSQPKEQPKPQSVRATSDPSPPGAAAPRRMRPAPPSLSPLTGPP